ncbi:MAG: cation diffusion facilitator family transporter [Candidatus Rifleibacteriota bacterium]
MSFVQLDQTNEFNPLRYLMKKTIEESEIEGKEIKNVTIAGMTINIFLTLIKITAGYIGNSQSVIADGIHSLSDCSTDIAVLVGLKYWNQPPDDCHPYGHRRIETMVAILIAMVLFLAGVLLCYEALQKFITGQYVVPMKATLIVSIISIVVKEFLFRWTLKVADRVKSPALVANAWHHRTDSISSVAVAIAISFALYNPRWAILDPLAAFAVGLFIMQAAYSIVKPALRELADSGATKKDLDHIREIVLKVDGVKSIHAIRTRFHGPGLQIDLHLQVDGNLSVSEGHEIAGHAKRHLLEDGPGVVDVLVHIEPDEERK